MTMRLTTRQSRQTLSGERQGADSDNSLDHSAIRAGPRGERQGADSDNALTTRPSRQTPVGGGGGAEGATPTLRISQKKGSFLRHARVRDL